MQWLLPWEVTTLWPFGFDIRIQNPVCLFWKKSIRDLFIQRLSEFYQLRQNEINYLISGYNNKSTTKLIRLDYAG